MGIKIMARTKEEFEKIEKALELLPVDTVKKFEVVEKGDFDGIIKLSAEWYTAEDIYIKADKITRVSVLTNTSYDKEEKGYKEINKYIVSITFEISKTVFSFILNNRSTPNIKIISM